MDKPWKVIFAFIGVFIAGAIFGGVFSRGPAMRRFGNQPFERPLAQLPPANQPRPQVAGPQGPQGPQQPTQVRPNSIPPQLMRRFEKRLSLTAEQQKKFRPIVGRAGEDLERMRQASISDVRRVTERMYADVSEILTMEQRVELEQIRKQEEERVQMDAKKRRDALLEAASRAGNNPATARPNDPPPGTP